MTLCAEVAGNNADVGAGIAEAEEGAVSDRTDYHNNTGAEPAAEAEADTHTLEDNNVEDVHRDRRHLEELTEAGAVALADEAEVGAG